MTRVSPVIHAASAEAKKSGSGSANDPRTPPLRLAGTEKPARTHPFLRRHPPAPPNLGSFFQNEPTAFFLNFSCNSRAYKVLHQKCRHKTVGSFRRKHVLADPPTLINNAALLAFVLSSEALAKEEASSRRGSLLSKNCVDYTHPAPPRPVNLLINDSPACPLLGGIKGAPCQNNECSTSIPQSITPRSL